MKKKKFFKVFSMFVFISTILALSSCDLLDKLANLSLFPTSEESSPLSSSEELSSSEISHSHESSSSSFSAEEHVHKWNNGVITQEATCTSEGEKTYRCIICFETRVEKISKLTHKYETVVISPTCEAKGYTLHTCKYCGDNYKDTYKNALGHNKVIDAAVAATCEETGLTQGSHCSRCDKVITKQNVTPAKGHIYENKKCVVCGAIMYTSGLQMQLSSDRNSYIVTGKGSARDYEISIPLTYNSKPVTAIADNAFKDDSRITFVNISDNIKTIGKNAFNNCTSLTKVIVGKNLKTIDNSAFESCSALSSITLTKVESINESAFRYCHALENISFPTSLKYIGDFAFANCNMLSNISFSKGLVSIGTSAFQACNSIINLTLPDTLRSIGEKAFYRCNEIKTITIPGSVKTIGNYAFAYCNNLLEINLPYGVESIGIEAFSYCRKLASVKMANSVTTIGHSAFIYCSSLKELVLSERLTRIESKVFSFCSSLPSITIPRSVIFIGDNAFDSCFSLDDVYYKGSKQQWNNIQIGFNTILNNAEIHYNS